MRTVKSKYLNDGKAFNDGRPVDLIQIENENDFNILLDNIISSGYYANSYFDSHIDYKEGEVKFDSFFLASILKFLKPKSLLELGCGRGDILFLIGLDERIKIQGIDFSPDVMKKIWPLLNNKMAYGDILEVCNKYRVQGMKFDTFCAVDLWEHLHPKKIHDYIDSVLALAKEDALFFFTIPAFGEDRVYGEISPLELAENQDKFKQRLPFDFLIAESLEPAIPVNGHLIWAHTEWWQKLFESHGLIRSENLEKNIHCYFDEHLYYAKKSFYIFHRDSSKARRRIKKLESNNLTFRKKWKILVAQQKFIKSFIKDQGKSFIDLEELKLTINHAEYYMILNIKKIIKRWIRISQPDKEQGVIHGFPSFTDRLINKCIKVYARIFWNRHYLIK